MSRVTSCNIEECQHNQEKTCQAGGIEVGSSGLNNKVSSAENTCCQTFKPKR